MNFEKLSFVGLSPTDYVLFYTVFEVQETLNVESCNFTARQSYLCLKIL